MTRHDDWLRAHDSSPVVDIDASASYRIETSDDHGATWDFPRETTGEHVRLDMTEALVADCAVECRDGVVIIQSPYPTGGLIRFTPTH